MVLVDSLKELKLSLNHYNLDYFKGQINKFYVQKIVDNYYVNNKKGNCLLPLKIIIFMSN